MAEDFDPISVLSNNKVKDKNSLAEVKEPFVEDVLMSSTLWPESQKLYGHAYEICCMAASYKGDCAATACNARQEEFCDIIIWKIV